MTLEFRILGELEVQVDGAPVDLSAPKLRVLLLRLLADVREPVSTDALIDALWDESPPASAQKLLQIYVSKLRKILGASAVRTAATGYLLDVPANQLDAHRFSELLADGRRVAASGNAALAASLFRQALALWRGPAFAEVRDEEFASAVTARLEELRAVCLEERLSAELAAGDRDAVAAEVAAVIARYPLRERLRAVQVRALAEAGHRAEALEAYQEARRVLRDELGLDPGPELREAQQVALQESPGQGAAAESSVLGTLPHPVTPLLGRERELADLQELLTSRAARLVTLTGAGGSGKTRLAIAAARVVEHTYANGVALVELAPLRDAALVPSAIAQSLGIKPSGADDGLAEIGEWLSQRELLLVVDNAEHLPDAFQVLSRLVTLAPRLTVLVTGRRVMHVSGEHVFPVGPLEEDASTALFVERARAAYPTFSLEGSESAVADICRRLDGLPLAIELAAARVGTLPPDSLLERLGSRLSLLTTGPSDLPARQRTLRETLEWSTNLLTPAQRDVLARMSAFPAGCTLAGAEEHLGADLEIMTGLVDDSLLRAIDIGGQRRFVMLETVREHADTLLGERRPAATGALVAYCVDIVERAELKGPNQARWLPVVDAEQDNIRAALAAATDAEARLRLVGGMWRYWWIRGQLQEGRAHIARALNGSDGADSGLRATALYGGAGLAWAAGALPEARDLANDALRESRSSGNAFAEMAANNCLGQIAMDEEDYAAAKRHHEAALAIAHSNDWEIDAIVGELNLALAVMRAGDLQDAKERLMRVMDYHRAHPTDEGIGFASLNLGDVAYRLGDVEAMREHFTEAHDAFTRVGFEANAAHALQGLAAAEMKADAPSRAAELLGRAARVLSRTDELDHTFEALAGDTEEAARKVLGDDAFDAQFERGRAEGAALAR